MMKFRKAAALATLVSAAASAFALTFSLEPFAGMRSAEFGEHLYANAGNGYKDLSELEWKCGPIPILGIAAGLEMGRLGAESRFSAGIPKRCGKMRDSDWIELNSLKTNYSISENSLDSWISFSQALSVDIASVKKFSFGAFAEFSLETVSFKARNGYGWYGDYATIGAEKGCSVSYNSPQAVYFSEGKLLGIDYKRTSIAIWAGAEVVFRPADKIFLSVNPAFAPYLYFKSIDSHHGSGGSAYYLDIGSSFFDAFRISGRARYEFNGRLSATLGASHSQSGIAKGSSYKSASRESGYRKLSGHKSGADFSEWNIIAGLRMRCF